MTIPGYLKEQAEQKDRDRQYAIDGAVARLEDAKAAFKLDIMTINMNFDAYRISRSAQIMRR